MKKIIMLFFASGLILMSCAKEKTCTCKDGSGTVVYQESRKASKSELDKFEQQCKNRKIETTVNGNVVSSVPCQIS